MTVQRIEERFGASPKKSALVVYLTVGDPSVEDTLDCGLAALEAGADVLELGVPFSDPTADGPVIAAASYRAIQRGGSLRAALDIATKIRKTRSEPLILFTYYNPVVAFGEEKAVDAAAQRPGVRAPHLAAEPPRVQAGDFHPGRDHARGHGVVVEDPAHVDQVALVEYARSGKPQHVTSVPDKTRVWHQPTVPTARDDPHPLKRTRGPSVLRDSTKGPRVHFEQGQPTVTAGDSPSTGSIWMNPPTAGTSL